MKNTLRTALEVSGRYCGSVLSRCEAPRGLAHAGRALAVAVVLTSCTGSGNGTMAYVGATAFDGSGAPPILDATILVANGRIQGIGSPDMVRIPRGAQEIRLDGKWVIPGLIDAHVHAARWTLPRYLTYGITSIRDMGGPADSVVAVRDSLVLGSLLGPRLYISGPMVDGEPATWSSATTVTDETAARRAVDTLVLLAVDQIKVYTKLSRALLSALLDEAQALDVRVVAHLGRVDALTAAKMGVWSLEHMAGVVEATVPNPQPLFRAHDDFFSGWNACERAWARLDSVALERTARNLSETRVTIVPTLALHETFANLSSGDFISHLDLDGVPQWVRDEWDVPNLIRRARLSAADFAAFRRSRPVQDLFVRRFRAAGGNVVAGSDSPNQLLAPGASLHRELQLLVDAGLSPEEALLTATRNAARLLEADSIGTLLPGNVADFIVLSGNPLDDIRNIGLIDRIVLGGTSMHPNELKLEW